MDWDTCNHKKLNQFQTEARRWKTSDAQSPTKSVEKKGQRSQPAKRKKRTK